MMVPSDRDRDLSGLSVRSVGFSQLRHSYADTRYTRAGGVGGGRGDRVV